MSKVKRKTYKSFWDGFDVDLYAKIVNEKNKEKLNITVKVNEVLRGNKR